ncbi:sulfotransferase domain-containing protein [Thiothrix nivea]|uniref:Sulfotransferase n=1 Tax=Thiothrix nivea (strain ATCC 35100 / DSM 5205 / JP2) TaxID=870187 RepID=A0A656HK65_THINJ|nr:sulfotransferase domain-containing protein [Thiothrix nivea]EIJ36867.1 sulfotransferase [Thiothrix nivea DSM 5205]
MKTIEICSYPKSGNTWVRHLVYQFLVDSGSQDIELPQDIHDEPEYVINERKAISTPYLSERISFYKSHVLDNTSVNPNRIIYIYRHPIDVFLSARNWFYKNSPRFKEERRKSIFVNGIPKNVDEAFQDGSLNYYFSEFQEKLGRNYWPGLLGETSNYFTHVISALENPKVFAIRYEDLLANTNETVNRFMSETLGVNFPPVQINLEPVTQMTKKHTVYWKATSGNRFKYLSQQQIDSFEQVYKDKLIKIGY